MGRRELGSLGFAGAADALVDGKLGWGNGKHGTRLDGRLEHLEEGAIRGAWEARRGMGGVGGYSAFTMLTGVSRLLRLRGPSGLEVKSFGECSGYCCVQIRQPGNTSGKGTQKEERTQKGLWGPFPI